MARKESITKNDIINAAFAILQEEGIEQVTARKLAAKAGCSTQPIFRVYKNMEELAEDLFAKACDFFQDYYSGFQKQTVTPFVHLGNIYIKFAAEHKKLFAFIFLSENRFGRSMYDLIPDDMRRHYDEGGKKCPLYYVEHEDAWEQFLEDLTEYIS